MTQFFRLITYFGTLIYLDPETSVLRHGRLGHVPENVMGMVDGAGCQLVLQSNGAYEPIADIGPGWCGYRAGDTATTILKIRAHDRYLNTLHWSGRLLTAEVEGTVSLFRYNIGLWESFLLLADEEFAEFKFLVENSWVQRRPARVFAPIDIALTDGFGLQFGEFRLPLDEVLRLVKGPGDQRPSRSLQVVGTYEGWKILFLRLYRPLVYFVAFGKPEIFSCASLAIDSLRALGGWRADIIVITDREHSTDLGVAGLHPIETITLQCYDVLDFALARYRIVDLEVAAKYQPVIYLDTDVVCNASLDELLAELCFSDDIHVVPEGPLMNDADFYGKTLFESDAGSTAEEGLGFSSGILAFRNLQVVTQSFRMIIEGAYEFARQTTRRDFYAALDQPFANYVLRKGPARLASLDRWAVGSSHVHEPETSVSSRRGLIHFAGGVGNAGPKLDRMHGYIKAIAKTGAPIDDEQSDMIETWSGSWPPGPWSPNSSIARSQGE